MSYVTQNFEDGKVLKAEHLNYIERNLVGISKNSDKVPGKANAFVSETSGDIVAFYPDEGSPLGVTSHIEPIQSGSGDPYPAGGGKNLLKNTATTETVNGVTFTVNADGTITANGTTTERAQFKVGEVDLPAGDYIVSKGFLTTNNDFAYLVYLVDGAAQYINIADEELAFTFTESTNLSYFVDIRAAGVTANNLKYYPMIRLASITDSTYAPYSNIRPISGHGGAKLTRCGKNLTGFAVPESIYGLTMSAEEHGFKIVGNCTRTYNEILFHSSGLKAGTYTLSVRMKGSVTVGGANLHISIDGTSYSIWKNGTLDGVYSRTINLSTDAESWNVRIACDSGGTYDVAITDIQLEIGSTATAYESYRGNDSFSADFGQTVYGGTLDWNTGVLTVDKTFASLTANNITYRNTNYDGTCGIFVIGYSGPKYDNAKVADIICSHCKTANANEQYLGNLNYVSINNSGHALITFKDIVTAEDGKAYVTEQANAGTPVQVCYELATPTTIQLTPQEILALKGGNTVYTNAGPVTVEYNKSLSKAFEEVLAKLAALEAAAVNNV